MPSPKATQQYHARRRRREAQDVKAYQVLIASPVDLSGGPLTLPANGYLAIGANGNTVLADYTITIGSVTLDVTALVGGAVPLRLGYFERGAEVTISHDAGVARTITVYLLDQWRRPFEIAARAF